MNDAITITLGWWCIPAAITAIVAFAATLYLARRGRQYGIGADLDVLILGGLGLIVILFAWAAYGLLT